MDRSNLEALQRLSFLLLKIQLETISRVLIVFMFSLQILLIVSKKIITKKFIKKNILLTLGHKYVYCFYIWSDNWQQKDYRSAKCHWIKYSGHSPVIIYNIYM